MNIPCNNLCPYETNTGRDSFTPWAQHFTMINNFNDYSKNTFKSRGFSSRILSVAILENYLLRSQRLNLILLDFFLGSYYPFLPSSLSPLISLPPSLFLLFLLSCYYSIGGP